MAIEHVRIVGAVDARLAAAYAIIAAVGPILCGVCGSEFMD
jgi:hypothetical protein